MVGLKLNSIIVQIEFYENSLFEVAELSEKLSIETIGPSILGIKSLGLTLICGDALPVQ